MLEAGTRESTALFAVYFPGFFMYTQSGCTVGSPEWVPDVDPCDWSGEAPPTRQQPAHDAR
jgi:hypothetical protein